MMLGEAMLPTLAVGTQQEQPFLMHIGQLHQNQLEIAPGTPLGRLVVGHFSSQPSRRKVGKNRKLLILGIHHKKGVSFETVPHHVQPTKRVVVPRVVSMMTFRQVASRSYACSILQHCSALRDCLGVLFGRESDFIERKLRQLVESAGEYHDEEPELGGAETAPPQGVV